MDIQVTQGPQPPPLFDQVPQKRTVADRSTTAQTENALVAGGPEGLEQKSVPDSIDQASMVTGHPATASTGNQVNMIA
jgi:hypothetical protein